MNDIQLSVVIAAHNAAGVIDVCLRALEGQQDAASMEVIVADSSTDATPSIVRTRFPSVRLFHVDEPLPVPALRGLAIAEARGAIVAVLDPFSVAAPDWASQVIQAHARRANLAIGGAVDLYGEASASRSAWSVYLNEYGLFMSPVVRGDTWILAGCNLSYKRTALFDGSAPRYPAFWKTDVNAAIQAAGSPLWLEPDVRVALNKPVPFGGYLGTRYLHGRCYAGMRVRQAPVVVRLARAASTPLVPFLLMWRWTAGFWPKGRSRGRFLTTLPAQLACFSMWAWGEAWGYLSGPGSTCEKLHY